jgi:phosphoribosylglycinamide formyltransferase-1
VHFVDEELDAGPIVIQAPVPVLDTDTITTLSARILHAEHRILFGGHPDCDRRKVPGLKGGG